MFYTGKTLDTFCPALDQLMEYERLPKISSADCVSLRAFGFCADGGAEEWFRPLLDTESAVRNLSDAAGLPFLAVHVCKGSDRMELPEAFVFGPAKSGIAAPAVSDRYYRGDGRYLFVQHREKKYQDSQIGCFIICLQGEGMDRNGLSREVSCETILERGIKYHKEIKECEYQSIKGAVRRYAGTQSERIALRYGILNMIQMLDKVFLLAANCGRQDMKTEYDEIKQQLFRMAESANIRELPGTLVSIWRSLENDGR